MQPLQPNKDLLTLIWVCQPAENTIWYIKCRNIAMCMLSIGLLIFGGIDSVVYIDRYILVDLENALYAIFQVAAEFSASYTLVSSVILSKTLDNLIKIFYLIHDKRKLNSRRFD